MGNPVMRFWIRSNLGQVAALAAATCLSVGGAALAQAPNASPPSGAYRVEPNHTEILFGVSHIGFTTYYGVFSGASGTLTFDGDHPAASRLEIHVPVDSILTPSSVLSGELKGAQWLNAAAFPEMIFRTGKITLTGPDTADVEGELTLHGVTRPLTLQAKFTKSGINPLNHMLTLGFEAHGRLRRSDYGVTTYVPAIGDEVNLILSAAFERAASVTPAASPK